MADRLVTLATFPTPVEAGFIRNLLEAAGLRAYLSDEMTGAMFWQLGNSIGWVKVQVAERDRERAIEILNEHRQILADIGPNAFAAEATNASDTEASPRESATVICLGCGHEVAMGAGMCWFCGAVRADLPLVAESTMEPSAISGDDTGMNTSAILPDTNSCPMCGSTVSEVDRTCAKCGEILRMSTLPTAALDDEIVDPLDELANRAFRAAGIGLIFFPVLFYAGWLIGRLVFTKSELSDSASRKMWIAFLITLVGSVGIWAFLRLAAYTPYDSSFPVTPLDRLWRV